MSGLNRRKVGHKPVALRHIKHINWVAIIVAISVTGFAWLSWVALSHRTNQANLTKKLNAQSQQLEAEIKAKEKANQDTKSLQEQLKKTQAELQAKRNRAVVLAEPIRQAFGGTCAEWVMGAGITDTASAMALIKKESNCNPYAVNRSSGACGVAQELPCGKSGCKLGDGACQVRWMNSYVLQMYKSWGNALAWHRSHNWY
jgi:hypothetical protein